MTTAANSADISSLPQADQDAIGVTLISLLLAGFREREAEAIGEDLAVKKGGSDRG